MGPLSLALTCMLAGAPVNHELEAELPPEMVRRQEQEQELAAQREAEAAKPKPKPKPEEIGDGTGHIILGGLLLALTTGTLFGSYYAYQFYPPVAIGPVLAGAGLGIVGGFAVRKGVLLNERTHAWADAHDVTVLHPTGYALMFGGSVLTVVGFGGLLGGLVAGELGAGQGPFWPLVGAGGGAFAGGVTMLALGLARNRRWQRWRAAVESRPGAMLLPGGAGLRISGRFAL